jgi:RNA polymerase sigma-70 factor, ECF subfamily
VATKDQDTVERFLRGEAEAVGTVNYWIGHAAFRYHRRLADCWDDVLEDVRMEVTRLLGEGKFRGESSLRTYLWRVVSHTCLDQLRAQSKWRWTDLDSLEEGKSSNARLPSEQRVQKKEDRDLLLQVLRRVPPDCREMWRMIVAGLSYREMSLRLNVPEGTLRVRVLRCREKAMAVRQELLRGGSYPPVVGVPEEVSSDPAESVIPIDPGKSGVAEEPTPEEAVQRFRSLQARLAADPRPFRDLPPEEKKARIRQIQGIGRGLFSSSEEFAKRKQEEIDLEERRRAR